MATVIGATVLYSTIYIWAEYKKKHADDVAVALDARVILWYNQAEDPVEKQWVAIQTNYIFGGPVTTNRFAIFSAVLVTNHEWFSVEIDPLTNSDMKIPNRAYSTLPIPVRADRLSLAR